MESQNPSPGSSKEEEPLVGWRHAGLVAQLSDGKVVRLGFESMTFPYVFGVRAEAFCREGRHRAPNPECGCGLYMMKGRRRIESGGYSGFVARPHNVLLQVAASGTVIEGERGFRASVQTVLKVVAPPLCRRVGSCRRRTAGFAPTDEKVISKGASWVRLVPVCSKHAPSAFVSLRDTEHMLGVVVAPAPPQHAFRLTAAYEHALEPFLVSLGVHASILTKLVTLLGVLAVHNPALWPLLAVAALFGLSAAAWTLRFPIKEGLFQVASLSQARLHAVTTVAASFFLGLGSAVLVALLFDMAGWSFASALFVAVAECFVVSRPQAWVLAQVLRWVRRDLAHVPSPPAVLRWVVTVSAAAASLAAVWAAAVLFT